MEFARQNLTAIVLTILSASVGVVLILAGPDSALLVGVGGSLLAAAFVSLLDFAKKFNDEGVDRFREAARKAGLVMVHRDRNIPTYTRLVGAAAHIDVSGYSLASFVGQHGFSITTRAKQNQVEVRVLLVDPTCRASLDQAAAEQAAGGSFDAQVKKVRQQFAGETRVKIRMIRTALPTMVFRIDDRVFVGPHFALPSTLVTTFELTSGWMRDQYMGVFDDLWETATQLQ